MCIIISFVATTYVLGPLILFSYIMEKVFTMSTGMQLTTNGLLSVAWLFKDLNTAYHVTGLKTIHSQLYPGGFAPTIVCYIFYNGTTMCSQMPCSLSHIPIGAIICTSIFNRLKLYYFLPYQLNTNLFEAIKLMLPLKDVPPSTEMNDSNEYTPWKFYKKFAKFCSPISD